MNSNKNNNLSSSNKLFSNPSFSYLLTITVVKPVRVIALLFRVLTGKQGRYNTGIPKEPL